MVNLLDFGYAAGGEARNYHSRARAQVTGAHGRSGELLHAFNDGDFAVHLNLGSQTAELIHIAVAVVPNALGEHAGALRQTEHRRDLGLHVCGETGVGQSFNVDTGQAAMPAHQHRVVLLLHLDAHLQQLGGDALQVLGNHVADEQLAAGGRNGGHIGACLDLVGNDRIGSAAEPVHSADFNDVGTSAHDIGAHGVEEVGKVHDMRLLGGVFNHRHAVGQSGGQHNVHSCADGHDVQIDLRALKTAVFGHGVNVAAAYIHSGSHGFKAFDMLVDGTAAEVAAAGRRHLGLSEAAQESADKIIGGPNFAGQLVRNFTVTDAGAVDVYRGAVHGAHLGAQILKNFKTQRYVADLRDIFNSADPVHQQSGGDDGYRRVFRAADFHGAMQLPAAMDHIFCQICTLYLCSIRWNYTIMISKIKDYLVGGTKNISRGIGKATPVCYNKGCGGGIFLMFFRPAAERLAVREEQRRKNFVCYSIAAPGRDHTRLRE
ncbi:hypothetical protein SDC9_89818 [bioreactor metagenome]|uniref:Uncharacterized protein n=1 Tax=bioreactor metagenome TaxID=1076179 RepID=A0A644ZQH6_9ZZZZ